MITRRAHRPVKQWYEGPFFFPRRKKKVWEQNVSGGRRVNEGRKEERKEWMDGWVDEWMIGDG